MKTKFKFILRKTQVYFSFIGFIFIMFGCAWGNQPIVWKTCESIDYNKSVKVNVNTLTAMPFYEIEYIKKDIEEKIKTIFINNSEGIYELNVTITRYDEGNAFARFMLIGLGQMYLYGDVKLIDSESQIVIRDGEFKKNYCIGGLIGGSATMRNDMTSKVGKAIAEALKK